MNSYLLEHFKRTSDPLGRGLGNATSIALGYGMNFGMAFPFPAGIIVLFRRRLYPAVTAWRVCGWARPAATTIANYRGHTHENNMGFQYSTARALGNGFFSELSEPVRVDIGVGAVLSPLPMFPKEVTAKAIGGGAFEISWEYDPYGHGAYPEFFAVFEGFTISLDYDTPILDVVSGTDTIPYVSGRRSYMLTTAAYADGALRYFGVRAFNGGGGNVELNTFTAGPYRASATGPSAARPLSVAMRR